MSKTTLMLKIKPLDESLIELYMNHKAPHAGDSGLDLFFPVSQLIPGGTSGSLIDFRIQCEMVEIFEDEEATTGGNPRIVNKPFMVVPRSSIFKTPIRQANSIGIIDSGFRGRLMVPVDNIDMPGNYWTLDKHSRLFQVISPDLRPFSSSVVEELSDSERGELGYGSSGI